jgi:hypothetical protein
MRKVIGLCGVAGSGKSTAATLLVERRGFSARPFAWPLKRMLRALGVLDVALYGPREAKERPIECLGDRSARHAMQTLGDWGRGSMGEAFWVDAWRRSIAGTGHVVADDVRFPNEAQAIRDLGGIVIGIERDGAGDRVNPGHISEAVDRIVCDVVIVNNGSLDDLLRELDRALSVEEGETNFDCVLTSP